MIKLRKLIILTAILYLSIFESTPFENALADLKIGTTVSSATAGRLLPGPYLAIGIDGFGISASAVGFQNTLAYMSAYNANAFVLFHPGSLLWGRIEAGIGVGAFYYKMGMKQNLSDIDGENKRNMALGPSIRVVWYCLGWGFVGVESMLGLRSFLNILLSFQDSTQLVAGIAF